MMKFLPKEDLYAPPLNIRVCDKRAFGRQPMVGTHVIGSLKSYYVDPTPEKIIVESFGSIPGCYYYCYYWYCLSDCLFVRLLSLSVCESCLFVCMSFVC